MARPVSVNGLVNAIMAKYDHNKNGEIELKRPDGYWNKLRNPDERVRAKASRHFDDDEMIISTSVYTMRDLFYAADQDNDGKVTREEMTKVVKGFDKDGDGEMKSRGFWGWLTRKPEQELDHFNAQYHERKISYGDVDKPLK